MFDSELVRSFYGGYRERVAAARSALHRPLTLAEKILYAHLYDLAAPSQSLAAAADQQSPAAAANQHPTITPLRRLTDFGTFRPDRVAMQDATAQMALLQFMSTGREKVSVPASIHCDHLICARSGAAEDLAQANRANAEVYTFLKTAAARYGIGFWQPGAGIIHQIVLENYAFPGGMMVGTDSHTPNAGGAGMLAIGVGGADAVDVLTGMPWELKMPKLIGVELTGKLSGWASAKDVILKLAGILTVKGGTNAILEYFGPGAASLSCTGAATICNMGAEVGATTSLFPYSARTAEYLKATGRAQVAALADAVQADLRADDEVLQHPAQFYDEVITIDLSALTPHINGPFTPDAARPVGALKDIMDSPRKVEVALIGSCTNSSYQDLARAASVAKGALEAGLRPKARLIVVPGSEQIRLTAERDGLLETLRQAGATVMANACGPCIGQWDRYAAQSSSTSNTTTSQSGTNSANAPASNSAPADADAKTRRNTIVTTFNRNFAKRADGNPNTHAFIVSPEMAVAYLFAGDLAFDPQNDTIDGVKLTEPSGPSLPPAGFVTTSDIVKNTAGTIESSTESGNNPAEAIPAGYLAPQPNSPEPEIKPDSERLQKLRPFDPWDGQDFTELPLLIKVKGKCTTDHISMAGPWLKFRGHLEHISDNLLLGATDAFTGQSGPVAPRARALQQAHGGSIVVAEENYGEGSSREHAAMEPRFLGVKAILAKSFARIHETNLKKQGVLALTFADPADYDKVRQDDRIDVRCAAIQPGTPVEIVLHHADGTKETLNALHTYNAQQLAWFRAGSALNTLKK